VAVARSSSGGVAICYVLPVLWMTSRLAVMGRMAMRYRGRSVISMNALLLVVFLLGFHVLRKQRGRRSVEADGRVDCRWNEMVNFLHIEHVHFHLLL